MMKNKSMKKILIIEDDQNIRSSLEHILKSAHYDVLTADNGLSALEMLELKSRLPDLIILDLMMPIMNGFEFRAAQQKDPRFSKIPVILLTANDKLVEFKEKLQAFEFLNKPVDVKDLLFVLENFFMIKDRSGPGPISSLPI